MPVPSHGCIYTQLLILINRKPTLYNDILLPNSPSTSARFGNITPGVQNHPISKLNMQIAIWVNGWVSFHSEFYAGQSSWYTMFGYGETIIVDVNVVHVCVYCIHIRMVHYNLTLCIFTLNGHRSNRSDDKTYLYEEILVCSEPMKETNTPNSDSKFVYITSEMFFFVNIWRFWTK